MSQPSGAPYKPRAATPHISRFLGRITRLSWRRRGFSDHHLIEYWPSIVGAQLAAFSQPARLSRRTEGGAVLTVRVDGAMALEVQHLAPQIIERLNSYYGHQAIGRLKIVQAPVATPHHPAPEPAPTAEEIATASAEMDDITSPHLRNALARLRLRLTKRL